jgi:hypothetical protein
MTLPTGPPGTPPPISGALPTTLAGVLIIAVALVILWIIVSIPVYAAGEVVTNGRAGFGAAMGATLGGGLLYFIILYVATFFLEPLVGPPAVVLGFILALVGWLAVYRSSFDTSWLGTIAIVMVAWLVFFILDIFLTITFGVSFPKFYPF